MGYQYSKTLWGGASDIASLFREDILVRNSFAISCGGGSITWLLRKHKTHKQYTDIMIAAMAKAGKHIVVTRNKKHFLKFLPKSQIVNWIDEEP